jgi:hypothetical protein
VVWGNKMIRGCRDTEILGSPISKAMLCWSAHLFFIYDAGRRNGEVLAYFEVVMLCGEEQPR